MTAGSFRPAYPSVFAPGSSDEGSQRDGERFPQFFTASPEYYHRPAEIPQDYWLSQLFEKLEPAELQAKLLRSCELELASLFRDAHQALDTWVNSCRKQTRLAYQNLLLFCRDIMTDAKGEPLQIPDKRYLEKLQEAILSHAPWYVRFANSIGTKMNNIKEWCKGIFSSFVPGARTVQTISEIIRENKEELQQYQRQFGETRFSTPEQLAEECTRQPWVPAEWTKDQLQIIWNAVIKALSKYRLEIDPEELDRMAKNFWDSFSRGKAVKLALKSALVVLGAGVALGGLVTAAIDAGATLFSSFSLTNWLATQIAGAKMLTAAAISGAFTYFSKGLIETNSLPALAALFALACDGFGLPRQNTRNRTEGRFRAPTAAGIRSAGCPGSCSWSKLAITWDRLMAVDGGRTASATTGCKPTRSSTMTQTTSVQLTDKNASLLQEAKQWGEKIVNAATIVFHESNTTNKIRRTVADYEEFCERLLRRNQSGPIPIVLLGRTGEGKSWLAHCFLRNRSPRHFADDPTDQQTKLLWLGPEEPPDLQPQEKYYRIPAEQMLDLGVPYLIGDAPGFSCSDEGIELAHRLAISTATVYLMVMRDASLRNGETARLVRELSGTCVVPVIRFRGNRGQAEPSLEMQQTIQKELERWRSTSANTQIAEPILVPDASLYSPDDVTPALKLTQQRLQVGLGAIVAQQARLRLNLENEFAYAARHAPDNCVNTCES